MYAGNFTMESIWDFYCFVGVRSSSTKQKPHRPCVYCGLFYSKLSAHLINKHQGEPEVKQAVLLPKQDRTRALAVIRKQGIWKVNLDQMKSKDDLSTESPAFLRERVQSKGPVVYCSLCKGFFAKNYYYRHRKYCSVYQYTTSSALPLNPDDMCTPKVTASFKAKILSKFHNSEAGNLCRTDTLIYSFGLNEFKNIEAKKSKKDEKRQSLMSDMRRLAHLYLEFKEILQQTEKCDDLSSLSLFERTKFKVLWEAIIAMSTKEDGALKAGLKIGIGYLLKRVIKFLNGEYLIQMKDKEADEIMRFRNVLIFFWPVVFGDAEYSVTVDRQKELRKPQRLPLEEDIMKLKEWLEGKIKDITEYDVISPVEYSELRDMIVCRLTMFNARRGGEPARLLLSEWKDAENGKWFDSSLVQRVEDPLENHLLCQFKVAYQAGKRQLVPLLLPEDCWKSLRLLADDAVRQHVGIGAGNQFLFPTTSGSDHHVMGWNSTKKCCQRAGILKDITANDMRHRAATLYASLDIPERERQAFYAHMGHSESINKNIYQCPAAVKEVLVVGKFLSSIDSGKL